MNDEKKQLLTLKPDPVQGRCVLCTYLGLLWLRLWCRSGLVPQVVEGLVGAGGMKKEGASHHTHLRQNSSKMKLCLVTYIENESGARIQLIKEHMHEFEQFKQQAIVDSLLRDHSTELNIRSLHFLNK